jgi:DNA polymerase-4
MTGAEGLFGAPETIGRKLKAAIREATGGLTVSVGISGTKYVAKVASGYAKPDALTIVPPDRAKDWLAPQPVAVLWGAGPKMQARLAALGLDTVGDVTAFGQARLEAALGKTGRHFFELAAGRDPRPVESVRSAQTMSSERTLVSDLPPAELRPYVRQAAGVVARRLRDKAQTARGVRLKLKTRDFRILTRQRQLGEGTSASEIINATAQSLLNEVSDPGPFRLIGVAVFDFHAGEAAAQLDLLAARTAGGRLDTALDAIHVRFGPRAVQRASDLMNRTVFTDDVNLDYLKDDAPVDEDP